MTCKTLVVSLALIALLGGGALLTERRATLREARAEAAHPPTGQFLTVEGRQVHAVVQGSGPDLVLLHGANGNTREFETSILPTLARDFRVIAFDRPGLGWSDDLGAAGQDPAEQARVLRLAANQLGAERPLVLGHSYGGAVAMAWGLQAPADTAGLIVVSGATMPWDGGLGAAYAMTAHPLSGALLAPMITAFATPAQIEATVQTVFAPDAMPAGYIKDVAVPLALRRQTVLANARQVNNLKRYVHAMRDAYPQLDLPVELLHGDIDTIVPMTVHAERLQRLLPDAALTVIPGAGHMPHHTHPEAVLAAIRRAATRAGF